MAGEECSGCAASNTLFWARLLGPCGPSGGGRDAALVGSRTHRFGGPRRRAADIVFALVSSKETRAVSCRGLVKKYERGPLALDGLDLEVQVGECFGLLGPNGAGKTTTVEILEGLLEPTAGEVEVLGMRWGTDARALR